MKNFIKQRGRRGAVLVESIVVISFFTLCFLGVLYFRELYLRKMGVQRLARASAMAHAMGACEGDAATGLDKDLGTAPVGKGGEPGTTPGFDTKGDDTAQRGLAGLERASTGSPFNKITKISLASKAAASTRPGGSSKRVGFQGEVSSTSFVTCGDPVSKGQYEEIIPHITSLF